MLIDLQRHPSNTYAPLIPNYPALLESSVAHWKFEDHVLKEIVESKDQAFGFAKRNNTGFVTPSLIHPNTMEGKLNQRYEGCVREEGSYRPSSSQSAIPESFVVLIRQVK